MTIWYVSIEISIVKKYTFCKNSHHKSFFYFKLSSTFLWQFTNLWFWITKATKQAKLTNRQSHFSLLSTIHHLSPDFAFKLIVCKHAFVIVWNYVVQNMKGGWHRYFKFSSSTTATPITKWQRHETWLKETPHFPWSPSALSFLFRSWVLLICPASKL